MLNRPPEPATPAPAPGGPRSPDPGPAEPGVDELVRRHAGPLLAAARRLARDEDEARGMLAEALETAVRRADRRPRGATLDHWLVRLLVETSLARADGSEMAPSIG